MLLVRCAFAECCICKSTCQTPFYVFISSSSRKHKIDQSTLKPLTATSPSFDLVFSPNLHGGSATVAVWKRLREVSACVWMRSYDAQHYGTLWSYVPKDTVPQSPSFILYDYGSLKVRVFKLSPPLSFCHYKLAFITISTFIRCFNLILFEFFNKPTKNVNNNSFPWQ